MAVVLHPYPVLVDNQCAHLLGVEKVPRGGYKKACMGFFRWVCLEDIFSPMLPFVLSWLGRTFLSFFVYIHVLFSLIFSLLF